MHAQTVDARVRCRVAGYGPCLAATIHLHNAKVILHLLARTGSSCALRASVCWLQVSYESIHTAARAWQLIPLQCASCMKQTEQRMTRLLASPAVAQEQAWCRS